MPGSKAVPLLYCGGLSSCPYTRNCTGYSDLFLCAGASNHLIVSNAILNRVLRNRHKKRLTPHAKESWETKDSDKYVQPRENSFHRVRLRKRYAFPGPPFRWVCPYFPFLLN